MPEQFLKHDSVSAKLDEFTRAFFEAALFSSCAYLNDDGVNTDSDDRSFLDHDFGLEDMDRTCLESLAAECASFQEEFGAAIDGAEVSSRSGKYSSREIAGSDLWYTRCGHGCGFWDGDWPEPLATLLTDAAERLGNVDLYLGDDGRIYAMGYEGESEAVQWNT